MKKIKEFLLSLLGQLKDKTNLIIFACVLAVLYAPTWLVGLLGIIFQNAAMISIATAYAAFWALPVTPFWITVFAVTFGIRKIVDAIRNKKAPHEDEGENENEEQEKEDGRKETDR